MTSILPSPVKAEQTTERQACLSAPSIAESYRTTDTMVVVSDDKPRVSELARRIHGWTWQAVSTMSCTSSFLQAKASSTVPCGYGHQRRFPHTVWLERGIQTERRGGTCLLLSDAGHIRHQLAVSHTPSDTCVHVLLALKLPAD